MSYIDQERRSRPLAVGGVVLLHVAIGYAFITGLAYRVIHITPPTIFVDQLADDPPPPPLREAPKPPPRATHPDPIVPRIIEGLPGEGPSIATTDPVYPPFKTVETPQPPPPPITSHARKAVPTGSRGTWVTTDDYPAQALREEVQGVTGIDVTIGADGRVTACSVTASSGSELLDQATCRLYARRARFQPALDDDGKATIGHYADRIRWTIPQ